MKKKATKKFYVEGVSLQPGHKLKATIAGVSDNSWYIVFPASHQGFYDFFIEPRN